MKTSAVNLTGFHRIPLQLRSIYFQALVPFLILTSLLYLFQYLTQPAGRISFAVPLSLEPPAIEQVCTNLLPTPWQSQDVGLLITPGEACFDSSLNRFIAKGAGANLSNTEDKFHFVYQPVVGDVEIIAELTYFDNNSSESKAGIMIRSDLDEDASHAYLCQTPVQTLQPPLFTYREAKGDTASTTLLESSSSGSLLWLRLIRRGDVFAAYTSNDGKSWDFMKSTNIIMGDTVWVGMAVNSQLALQTSTAYFEHVKMGHLGKTGHVLYVDKNAFSGGDGQSWGSAFQDVQEALLAADFGDTLFVATGTYTPGSQRESSIKLSSWIPMYGGFLGTETHLSQRMVDSTSQLPLHPTILTGDHNNTPGDHNNNCYNVLDASFVNGQALLDGFIIERGNANRVIDTTKTIYWPQYHGGGIVGDYCEIKIRNCLFKNNRTTTYYGYEDPDGSDGGGRGGGGGYFLNSSPTLINCVFLENEADSTSDGGALMFEEVCYPVFTDCLFERNKTIKGRGGAIFFLENGIHPTFTDCSFRNNYVEDSSNIEGEGGALCLIAGNLSDATIDINNCFFDQNTAILKGGTIAFQNIDVHIRNTVIANGSVSNGDGGAIQALQCDIQLDTVSFRHNTADKSGGAIFLEASTLVRADSCQFVQNKALEAEGFKGGGGLAMVNSSTASFQYCLFKQNEAPTTYGFGGGITMQGGSVRLDNCRFEENLASESGGAIASLDGDSLILRNCDLISNKTNLTEEGEGGGGFFIKGSILSMDNCYLENNTSYMGGAVSLNTNSSSHITSSIFKQNKTTAYYWGGGAIVYARGGDHKLIKSQFIENHADLYGGAIFSEFQTNVGIRFCYFAKNSAGSLGGAFASSGGGPATRMESCTFLENHSQNGGAIFYGDRNSVRSATFLSNCTFSANKADEKGGAIHMKSTGDSILMNHCTFKDDSAALNASVIYVETGELKLQNSIIDNVDPNFLLVEGGATFSSLGHNLYREANNTYFTMHPTDLAGMNPGLDSLAFYGGPIDSLLTYRLLPTSPAIRKGPPLTDGINIVDQRGYSRTIGVPVSLPDSIDIGAFESQQTFINIFERALCLRAETFSPLSDIVIIDSTGGAFGMGDQQTLTLSLPNGFEFSTDVGIATATGSGLTIDTMIQYLDSITLVYDRAYDSTLNEIRISGLWVIPTAQAEKGLLRIIRTGGDALQYGNMPKDSASHGDFAVFRNSQLADQAYREDFELGLTEWKASSNSSYKWEWGKIEGEVIDTASSGISAWATGMTDQYPANVRTELISPCFDFRESDQPMLSFDIWTDTEDGFDGATIQYSTNAGDTWQPLGQVEDGANWYNDQAIISDPGGNSDPDNRGWTGRSMQWKTAAIRLDQLIDTPAVRFRMVFSSSALIDTSETNSGIAIDNFFVGERTRKLLVEHYTNSASQNQIGQLNTIAREDTNQSEVLPVHYVISAGDPYYADYPIPSVGLAEAHARALYYGISEPGILTVGGFDSLATQRVITQPDQSYLDSLLLQPAQFDIQIEPNEEKPIQIIAHQDFPDITELVLHTLVVERIPDLDSAAFLRKMLPNAAGISLFGIEKDLKYSFSPGSWSPTSSPSPEVAAEYDNLIVIVFIQNFHTKEIYQVATAPVWESLVKRADVNREGLFPTTEPAIRLFPNPAQDVFSVDFGETRKQDALATLTDMRGIIVRQVPLQEGEAIYPFEVQTLPAGVYHLVVQESASILFQTKIVVLH